MKNIFSRPPSFLGLVLALGMGFETEATTKKPVEGLAPKSLKGGALEAHTYIRSTVKFNQEKGKSA